MPILTLTTDFGDKCFDVAALKGKIMCTSYTTRIVDITHNVEAYDKINAAYALKNASVHFPENTIHFTNININEGNGKYLIVERKSQFYICPDNGFINIMFPEEDFKAYYIKDFIQNYSFVDINNKLCEIVKFSETNSNITEFGTLTSSFLRSPILRSTILPDLMQGSIIYIDRYENAVVNITKDMFYNYVGENSFTISVRGDEVSEVSNQYSDAEQPGDMVCIFNSENYLEIAIFKGKACSLLNLEYGHLVMIEKYDSTDSKNVF